MSVSSFLFSFCWGFCILSSFVGWGSLLKRWIFPEKDFSWAEEAAWGVAFSVVIGGLLNLSGAISQPTLISYVGLGCINFLTFYYQRTQIFLKNAPGILCSLWREDRIALFTLGVVGALLLLNYALSVIGIYFNIWDDCRAYFVFPQKMIEQGFLGMDPFSDRRTGILGGHSFLQALVVSVLPFKNIHIMDYGLGCIIGSGLLYHLGKKLKVARKQALLVIALFLLLLYEPANSSSIVMNAVMILSVFCFLKDDGPSNVKDILRRSFIVALLLAGGSALKTNFIVCASLYFVSFYVLSFLYLPNRKYVVWEFFIISFLAILFLLPWMLAAFQASGTLLYPLLGRGFHRSAYGVFEFPPATLKVAWDTIFQKLYDGPMLLLIGLSFFVFQRNTVKRSISCAAMLISVFISAVTIFLLTYVSRYYGFFLDASLYTMMLYAFSSLGTSDERPSYNKKALYVLIILFIPMLFQPFISRSPGMFLSHPGKVLENLNMQLYSGEDQERYSKAQGVVPSGATILAQTDFNLLFNFRRNPIFIVDWVIFGPKPGMPIYKGAEAVAEYLLSKGVRYVVYRRNLPLLQDRYPHDEWLRQQAELSFVLLRSLRKLRKTRKILYDDQNLVVLDLGERVEDF